MSLLIWSTNYSVRIKSMDDQHRKLVEIINELDDSLRKGLAADAQQAILRRLIDYTRTHFADEERLMQNGNFPEFRQHKAQHDAFARQVLEFQKQVAAGQAKIGPELLSLLRDWLINHIMGSDKSYGSFLTRQAAA